MEMYLKKTSGRELPTVVYPELYRKRFYEAMDRYFTVVPDKWSGLGVDF
jgi:1-phosphatidylinositol-3-phosphate 5-kinase